MHWLSLFVLFVHWFVVCLLVCGVFCVGWFGFFFLVGFSLGFCWLVAFFFH